MKIIRSCYYGLEHMKKICSYFYSLEYIEDFTLIKGSQSWNGPAIKYIKFSFDLAIPLVIRGDNSTLKSLFRPITIRMVGCYFGGKVI